MTVGLYISPGDVPCIIGDTLATSDNTDFTKLLTPSIKYNEGKIDNYEICRLVRKVNFLNKRTCITLAGLEDPIREFVCRNDELIDHISRLERPMRILGDNANETPGVEMVGVHVYDDHMNTVSPIKNRFTLENFGQCAAIGSGMNFAKKLAAEWDRMTNRPNNPHDCYEIIRGFSSAFCSAILANEFIFSNIESWGGFIEYASYFDDNKSWSYGPKSAYTFAFIEFIGDNKFTIHQINKFVLYEGNINCGRILSIHQDDRKFIATQWVLENIIGYNIPADDPKFWNGWFPDSITTCFIFPKEMNYAISHKTTDWHQKNEFTCEIRDNYVKLGLSDNLIDEVGLELTGFLKRSYIEQKYKIFYSS